jgi:hypothetical protein
MLLLRSAAPNFCESRVIGEAAGVTTRRFDIFVGWQRWQFEIGPENNSENGSNQPHFHGESRQIRAGAPPPPAAAPRAVPPAAKVQRAERLMFIATWVQTASV